MYVARPLSTLRQRRLLFLLVAVIVGLGSVFLLSAPLADAWIGSNRLHNTTPPQTHSVMLVETFIDTAITDGLCTLREAMTNANNNAATFPDCPAGQGGPTLDVIEFDPSLSGFTINLSGQQLPPIVGRLHIDASMVTSLSVSGINFSRLFKIEPSGNVTITNLIMTNGFVATFNGATVFNDGYLALVACTLTNGRATNTFGGGVYNGDTGTLVTQDTVFTNHIASYGGAIYNDGGVVDITGGLFNLNLVNNNGGAIYNNAGDFFGSVNMANVTLDANTALTDGGAIYNNLGSFTFVDSTLTSNNADNGGAVYGNGGAVVFATSVLSGNHANIDGGAVYNGAFGFMGIDSSTFATNDADGDGGGLYVSLGTVDMKTSTFNANRADDDGGGIFAAGTLGLVNTTVSGNNVGDEGGGIFLDVLAIPNLSNISVVNNSAVDRGGGLFNLSANLKYKNSIIAGNIAADTPEDPEADCVGVEASYSQGYNITGEDTGCTPHANDLEVDPNTVLTDLLLPLADNGGPTATHAFLPISQVLDSGNPAGCTADAQGLIPLTVDQRGEPRPGDGTTLCDAGAYELQFFLDQPDLRVTQTVEPVIAAPGDYVTYTLSFANIGFVTAIDVQLEDIVPAGLINPTYVNSGAPITLLPGDPFSWEVDDLTPGASGVITIYAQVDPLVSNIPVVNNEATIVTSLAEGFDYNNTAIASFNICPTTLLVVNGEHSGPGSLRQALLDAGCDNNLVVFDPLLAGGVISLTSQIKVEDRITIDGSAAPGLTINGNELSRIFRIEPSAVVTLSNLTIARGREGDFNGGAIWNQGVLTLDNVLVRDSLAPGNLGGGIYNKPEGTLTLQNGTVISGHTALNGAGLYNDGGRVVINGAIFTDNTATSLGGGLYNLSSGTLELSDATLIENTASLDGGGLYNSGTLTMTRTNIEDNHANDDGGGVFNAGFITITTSTIHENSANDEGGGIHNDTSDILFMKNGTLSGNTTNDDGAGIFNRGTAEMSFVTIANNVALDDGGGVYDLSFFSYKNSIIAGNSANGSTSNSVADCVNITSLDSLGYNVVGLGTGCTVGSTDATTPSSTVFTLEMEPLADNGGPTLTHALRSTGVSVDRGDPESDAEACADYNGYEVVADQRELVRPGPGSAACDSGAYELDLTVFADLKVSQVISPPYAPPGAPVTFTISFSNTGWATATGVLLVDILPITITNPSYTSSGPAIFPIGETNYIWLVENLAPYVSGVVTITGVLSPDLEGIPAISNTVAIASLTPEFAPVTNVITDALQVCQAALTVENDRNGGPGSLRQSLIGACDGSLITFDPELSGGIITLSSSPLVINRQVTLDGSGAPGLILSGNLGRRIFEIGPRGDVVIQDLDLTRGNAGNDVGGLILNLGTVEVTNGSLSSSRAARGGAIYNAGTLTVTNVTLDSNTGTFEGGAVSNEGLATLTDATLSNNGSPTGGAIWNSGQFMAQEIAVVDSEASLRGGAIWNSGDLTFTLSIVDTATSGGAGGGVWNAGEVWLIESSITEADSDNNGGAIYSVGPLHITGSLLENSTAAQQGGALYVAAGSSADLTITTLRNNQAEDSGGALYNAGDLSLNRATLFNNRATDDGGGVYNGQNGTLDILLGAIISNTAVQNGGGLYNQQGIVIANLTDIEENQAQNGGALYNQDGAVTLSRVNTRNNNASLIGGGYYSEGGDLQVTNGSVVENSAGVDGGGAYHTYATAKYTLAVISSNSAGGDGGGVVNWGGSTRLEQTEVSHNSAAGDGGGLYIYLGLLQLQQSAVHDNTGQNGGGVYNRSLLQTVNSTLSGNDATSSGGGVWNQGLMTLQSATLANNTALVGGGVWNSGALRYQNSVVAGNRANGSPTDGSADCFGVASLATRGYNLTGLGTGCPTSGDNDQTINPWFVFVTALEPLADNGGATLTHALRSVSPALDAGNDARCQASPVMGVDQRGLTRVDQDGNEDGGLDGNPCDVGAYERQNGESLYEKWVPWLVIGRPD